METGAYDVRMRARSFVALTTLAVVALVLPGAARAQPVSEPAVKAAFLYKFIGYVEWPPQALPADSPYVVGTMGGDDVATELERIVATRSINGRRVVVRRLREGQGAAGLQMLFIARGQAEARETLLALQRQPVLTVTETDRGLELGSVVNLVTLADRVGFEVSLEAADRAGLLISSRMLAVARRVIARGGGT